MKNDSIKVILSTLTAIGGIGGTYKTMEDRVRDLEHRLQKQEQVLRVEIEVQKMRQEQIIDELKSKAKMKWLSEKEISNKQPIICYKKAN